MDKKVLAIFYSQTGQLGEIIAHFTAPFEQAGIAVETIRVQPMADYPFPWTGERFFGVMPDCVLSVPTDLQPIRFAQTSYDLIILGYQAWFLSPSIPSNSLLQDPVFRALLKDTPVITITGARNMWMNAFERVRRSLSATGAVLVGNIALADKHPNPISFVTIFHWMMHGKKDRYLNIFPVPGVAAADIENAAKFGELTVPHLQTGNWADLQAELLRAGAVAYKYKLMFIEARARGIFLAWAGFIVRRRNKKTWLAAFKYYLLIALFLGAPILLAVDALFIRPFLTKRINAKKQYYLELK
jgi:hypothetical protein